jgi:hypothetical protein
VTVTRSVVFAPAAQGDLFQLHDHIAAHSGEPGFAAARLVVQIDSSSQTTAFAKMQCQIPPRHFTDCLTFVKLADDWRIVSKTFHTETH